MRRIMLICCALGLASCSVQRMLPKGPVISEKEREQTWGDPAPPGVTYTTDPLTAHPIPVFLPFGVAYDLDIVLMSKHPKWDMHEYARIQTPEGPIWIAKDSRADNGDQLLVADVPDLFSWLPEVPLPRKKSAVTVTDESTGDQLDLHIEYENHDGEKVVVDYRGDAPIGDPVSKRNGSTMGHSRNQVIAVLDLSHQEFGDSASISIGGEEYGIEKVALVKPMRLALQQVQGGIAEGTYEIHDVPMQHEKCPGEPMLRTEHVMPNKDRVSRTWTVERTEDRAILRQCDPLRTLRYEFLARQNALELTEASVVDWRGETIFGVSFQPALPDPRRQFTGPFQSRFVMDVGDQRNHAVGTVDVRWDGTTYEVKWSGEEPWWVAERCAVSTVDLDDGIRAVTEVWPCENE